MNALAAQIADLLEADIENQKAGRLFDIGERWDELQEKVMSNRDFTEKQTIELSMRFWESWADSAQHSWRYHDPMTEEQWIEYAQEISECLRAGSEVRNTTIRKLFKPAQKLGAVELIRRWLGLGT